MAKKKTKDEAEFEHNLFWFMATAYVADAVGLVDRRKAAKLASLESLGGDGRTWQVHVRSSLDIDDAFVRKVFALCAKRKSEVQTLGFILRGLGCPCTEERLEELFG